MAVERARRSWRPVSTFDEEQLANLVFAALLPAARLGVARELPVRRLKQLAELASFRELKRRRWSLKEIAERLSVSVAKAAQLSRQLKVHFSQPDADYGATRRLLMLLRAGPDTEAHLVGALDDLEPEVVRAALRQLMDDGLVEIVAGRTSRYRICKETYRQVRQPWIARVDALTNLMASVADAIRARFFESDDRAFARTVGFQVRDSDLPKLVRFYEEQLFPLISELDDAASEADDGVAVSLSILWAPEQGPDDGQ